MSNEAFRKALVELSAEYRGSLPGKLAEIDSLWAALRGGSEPVARVADLRRLLHTIAGSARTFGLAEVGSSAKLAENFLGPFCGEEGSPAPECTLPAAADGLAFDALLEGLRRSATAS